MKRKNLLLGVTILAFVIFIGFMSESEPKAFFGMMLNIWVFRIAWLLITISFFLRYQREKKLEE